MANFARLSVSRSKSATRSLALMKIRNFPVSRRVRRSIHAGKQCQGPAVDKVTMSRGSDIPPSMLEQNPPPLASASAGPRQAHDEPSAKDVKLSPYLDNQTSQSAQALRSPEAMTSVQSQIHAAIRELGSEFRATKQEFNSAMSKIRISLKDNDDKTHTLHRFLDLEIIQPALKKQTDSTASGISDACRSLFGVPKAHEKYWQKIPRWKNIPEDRWQDYKWHVRESVRHGETRSNIVPFLQENLPALIPPTAALPHIRTREDFIKDFEDAWKWKAAMAVRITPHILSMMDWENPLTDPLIHQFIPLKSKFIKCHDKAELDALKERRDSPVSGLTHRYPHKALFISTTVCEIYCSHCTRLYTVGLDTGILEKETLRPSLVRWEDIFRCIEQTPAIQDVVVSGGDTYMLQPDQLRWIGKRLLSIPHVSRIRFATRGLAASPSRILDPQDGWFSSMVDVSNFAHQLGKQFAVHTQFNHLNEASWVTYEAAARLHQARVKVRNQTVLVRGVNDSFPIMSELQNKLDRIHFDPYYIFQCDMTRHVEHFRTPLQTILDMKKQFQGTMGGMAVPRFVVDLPGGGGKVDVAEYLSYDRKTGLATYEAPDYENKTGTKIYEHWDPMHSLL